MPGAVTQTQPPPPDVLVRFWQAMEKLREGYGQGTFEGRPWGVTVRRSDDGKRIWLYGEALGATDIVSFNLYVLDGPGLVLKPCEMSLSKVVDFVLGYVPT